MYVYAMDRIDWILRFGSWGWGTKVFDITMVFGSKKFTPTNDINRYVKFVVLKFHEGTIKC